MMSTSGKSAICRAFRRDAVTGEPTGDPVVVKISKNGDQLRRESDNFAAIIGRNPSVSHLFVAIHDYMPDADLRADAPDAREFGAIVMEEGDEDLRSYLRHHGGLRSDRLREACETVALTVKAIHDQGLVWTELKSPNFVLCRSDDGVSSVSSSPLEDMMLKAIDLESAVPVNEPNRDFTPQFTPPEFANTVALHQHRLDGAPSCLLTAPLRVACVKISIELSSTSV